MYQKYLAALGALALAACGPQPPAATPVAARSAPLCIGAAGGECGDAAPCKAGQRCVAGLCAPDFGTCQKDGDCGSDTYCAQAPLLSGGGVCMPWGTLGRRPNDALCSAAPFAQGDFEAPVVKCSRTGDAVLVSPVVIDTDGDGLPEILVATTGGKIAILSGRDCSLRRTIEANLTAYGAISAADLDGDGVPEILVPEVVDGNRLVLAVYSPSGARLAVAADRVTWLGGGAYVGGIGIANIDGKDEPEILFQDQILRYRSQPTPSLQVLYKTGADTGTFPGTPIAADLDGDGKQEVLYGEPTRFWVIDPLTFQDRTPAALRDFKGATVAVGDFNGDRRPEVVLLEAGNRPGLNANPGGGGRMGVYDWAAQRFLAEPKMPNAGYGSLTIGYFDGDGVPDIGVTGGSIYFVLSLRCAADPQPADCGKGDYPIQPEQKHVLWANLIRDSGQQVGSAIFDFLGNGRSQVVLSDESTFRIFDGATGERLLQTSHGSNTAFEYPVVADVDGDGHAEIVVVGDIGVGTGVRVFSDPQDRWRPARRLWNQYAYSITNVNDDGTVPARPVPSWLDSNTFRGNSAGGPPGALTLVGDATAQGAGDCTGTRLRARVCNRGSGPILAGLPVTFYAGDPRMGGSGQCTARTARALGPGQCAEVGCDAEMSPGAGQVIFANVNDDGSARRPFNECKEDSGNYARVCLPAGTGLSDGKAGLRCVADGNCAAGQACDRTTGVCRASAAACDPDGPGACRSGTCADLALRIARDPASAGPGDEVGYTVQVSSQGPAEARDVSVRFSLPPGTRLKTLPRGEGWTCQFTGAGYRCDRASLPPGDAPPITFRGVVPDGNASGRGPAVGGDVRAATEDPVSRDNLVCRMAPCSDLAVRLLPGPGAGDPGTEVPYTVAVKNRGPGAAEDLAVRFRVPRGAALRGAPAGEGWSCTALDGAVTCRRARLAPGDAPPITFRAVTPRAEELTAQPADSDAPLFPFGPSAFDGCVDLRPSDNVACLGPQCADLGVELYHSPAVGKVGEPLRYTVQVTNQGPAPVQNPVVSFPIPPGATLGGDAQGAGWSCVRTGDLIRCTRASLGLGAAPPIGFTLTPTSDQGSRARNAAPILTAAVGAPGFSDPNPANDTAVSDGRDKALGRADLVLTVTKDPAQAGLGQAQTFTLQATNKGPDVARGPMLSLLVPRGATITAAPAGDGWSCVLQESVVHCLRASLPPGDAPPVRLTLVPSPLVPAGGNGGSLAAHLGAEQNADPADRDNGAALGLAPQPATRADLAVQITRQPDPPVPGEVVGYTAQVKNKGPDAASHPLVVITVPPGSETTQPALGDGWRCVQASHRFLCVRDELAPGDAPPITLRVVPPPPGPDDLLPGLGGAAASVSAAGNGDPQPSDDSTQLRGADPGGVYIEFPAGVDPNDPSGGRGAIFGGGCGCKVGGDGGRPRDGAAMLALLLLGLLRARRRSPAARRGEGRGTGA